MDKILGSLRVLFLGVLIAVAGIGWYSYHTPSSKTVTQTVLVAEKGLQSTVTVLAYFETDVKNSQTGKDEKKRSVKYGTGFVVDPSGVIITNAHVVDESDKLAINFDMDREPPIDVRLIGIDIMTDIAVLQVDNLKNPLPATKLSSRQVRVGEDVIVIGTPYGLARSVSSGIVSNIQRKFGSSPYDYTQIDAAVNHGNSGGPLFDLDGEVVGMNTAIYSPDNAFVGIALSIPSLVITKVSDILRVKGKVDRGFLGVRYKSHDKGLIVVEVMKEGPAGKALQTGDLITHVNGKSVGDSRQFSRTIAETPSGSVLKITGFRKGQKFQYNVKLAELTLKMARQIKDGE